MGELERLRRRVEPMLDFDAPVDALYAYYALYHDPARTKLVVHDDRSGRVDGFVAVCQTGQRLFEPTVVLRTSDARAAVDLLHLALDPGRAYYVITTPDLREEVREAMEIQREETNHVFGLNLSRFEPSINVLVVQETGVEGAPRFIIRRRDTMLARSGVNWLSPHFAEIFVQTEPAAQGRGWGKAVVQACTRWVLRSGRQPLYVVNATNGASAALAQSIGYVDTGVCEFTVEGVFTG
jgi:predicted GNAT family acetyltransferase